jgi:hypothetical protein
LYSIILYLWNIKEYFLICVKGYLLGKKSDPVNPPHLVIAR